MSLKDVLVFLDATPASEGRMRLAARVARERGACLSAAFLRNGHAELPSGHGAASRGLITRFVTAAVEISQGAMLADIAETRLRDCLHVLGGKGDWHSLDRTDTAELIALAQTADLTIVGQINHDARPAPACRPEDIVAACGRPVLMVPYVGNYAEVGRRVLVAWDGSREAARAVNDALPLIDAAETVTVMTVRANNKDFARDRRSMDRMVRHLTRHGVPACAAETLSCDNVVSDVLLSSAMDLYVDMIVAGAGHHSPLREALVGGVNHELFRHMTVPVLMSH